MTGEGVSPPCPRSLFYELMDFTFELSKLYGVIPFEILKQDKDEVIMLLNYMAEKSEATPAKSVATPTDSNARKWVNDKTATGGWW